MYVSVWVGCYYGDVLVETQAIGAMEVHWISGRRLLVVDIDIDVYVLG